MPEAEQDSLGLYTHWLVERRKDDEARLKRLGLTWKELDKIEGEAMTQFPAQGMEVDGYKLVAGTRVNRIIPAEVASKFTTITETFIQVHGGK